MNPETAIEREPIYTATRDYLISETNWPEPIYRRWRRISEDGTVRTYTEMDEAGKEIMAALHEHFDPIARRMVDGMLRRGKESTEAIIRAMADCMAEDLAASHRFDFHPLAHEPISPGPGRHFGRNAIENYIIGNRIAEALTRKRLQEKEAFERREDVST